MIYVYGALRSHATVIDELFDFVRVAADVKSSALVNRDLSGVGHISRIRLSGPQRYYSVIFERAPVHDLP